MIDVAMGLLSSVPFMAALCFCIGQGLNGRNRYHEGCTIPNDDE